MGGQYCMIYERQRRNTNRTGKPSAMLEHKEKPIKLKYWCLPFKEGEIILV